MHSFLHSPSNFVPSDFFFLCTIEIFLLKAIDNLSIAKSVNSYLSLACEPSATSACTECSLLNQMLLSLDFVYLPMETISFAGSCSSVHFLNAGFLRVPSLACSIRSLHDLTHSQGFSSFIFLIPTSLSPTQILPPSFSLIYAAYIMSPLGCHWGPSHWPQPNRSNHQPLLTCSASCFLYSCRWYLCLASLSSWKSVGSHPQLLFSPHLPYSISHQVLFTSKTFLKYVTFNPCQQPTPLSPPVQVYSNSFLTDSLPLVLFPQAYPPHSWHSPH